MTVPLQITFRGMRPSPSVRSRIRELGEKLDQFHDRITSCRVVVRAPHRRHHQGRLYQVSVDLRVPGREIAVTRDPAADHAHEDVLVAVRDAFDAVARRLEDIARERRGEVKTRSAEPRGRVLRLFPDQGYGFIESPDEGEIYFHANSVPHRAFRRLKPGDEVRYSAEPGDKGLQATVVKPVGRRRAGA